MSTALVVRPATSKTFGELPDVAGLRLSNIECELWREYDFGGRTYRISDPVGLYFREGGSTHRVVDSDGVAHCLPGPEYHGCAIRWVNRDSKRPVNF